MYNPLYYITPGVACLKLFMHSSRWLGSRVVERVEGVFFCVLLLRYSRVSMSGFFSCAVGCPFFYVYSNWAIKEAMKGELGGVKGVNLDIRIQLSS